ncbi:MAG TPA: transcription-repair coupling factor, partial [Candidatus Paceibacterota bacterium]|nr:transcription-repair coupling factor [Candidatus Paceibacterota bacterium]
MAEPPMAGAAAESPEAAGEGTESEQATTSQIPALDLGFESLDAFRALTERPPEPQIAEVQRREFFAQLHRWLRQGYEVQVFFNNDGERERFQEIWLEYGLDEGPGGEEPAGARPALQTAIGMLSRGFLHPEARWVVVTDAEVFGRYKVQRPRRLKSPHAQALRSALDIDFTDLQEGDYVVHLQHGIGRYLGLRVLPAGAGTKPTDRALAGGSSGQECLVIEYAPADRSQPAPKLYVPVTEAHLVSKYVGAGKARPPLNSLGGTRWAKAKAQAERAVRDVASELLSIQAARASQPGHAFAADTAWQREFEAAFIYEETPDQLQAIQETKRDMERPRPMDRLICGDVGFGKTEVGIRAAFKAVMDGRQVAVLVPTTVLAQQHFNTFRERMADYPVRIELLSRFRTRRAQQRVVRELALGAVDIVIGTHRLLQDDIAFKDLGLVIIDEEQRFGVLHKERFKQLRRLVDVLTLSATPIPRTLYLALTGARDMSTIQTPPHDRLPVETIVAQYDERLIRDAIQRELNRGGQVFFLHNRVKTIQLVAQKLAALVPQARIAVGHGQMRSDELEEVMTRFVNGEADILLSTTIIESGLDIPNANTIIIDRADRFGLSDLYQLRGRVGRYKHQAYAYLLLPRHGMLVADVRKRLSAMKQYSTLGSGFKIAMRDLEIRGAGNLLGAEQSGHITAVGFDLYCELLKKSIAALKGERVKPRVEVQVRLDFLSLNPPEP